MSDELRSWKYFYLERPEEGMCEIKGCSREDADILCDLCNAQCCPMHSYDWTYPTSRGYDHPPQKIICINCANQLKETDGGLVETGGADDDPGRLRRRDGIAWEALRF